MLPSIVNIKNCSLSLNLDSIVKMFLFKANSESK